jgi:hypothetical protein
MSLTRVAGLSAFLLALCAGAASADEPAAAGPSCEQANWAIGAWATGICGAWQHCCPKTCFTREKSPCINFRCICLKPICQPCVLEGFGYYPTCWRPWPFPPNYCPCPVPPPGALVDQAPLIVGVPAPSAPGANPDEGPPPPPPKKAGNPKPGR